MNSKLVVISQGKLLLLSSEAEEAVSSNFASDLKRRLQSVESRAAVRAGGSGAAFMRGGLPGPSMPSVEDTFRADFSCVSTGTKPGEICYGIDAGEVRGLFVYEVGEKHERRVLHGPQHRFSAISARQTGDEEQWLVAAAQDHGVSRIGFFKPQSGGGIRELTEGDSLDSYPAWQPGEGKTFVYQTCGIARHQRTNEWQGLGPASIQKVDMETGEMEPVAEDDRFDFLCPAYAQDGSLYYLKRPYEPFHRPSFWRFLLDIVLFPFRLMRALLAFLNVFSMMFSGKPLQTAGAPPRRDGPDPKAVFLHGRWISMEKQMRDAAVDEMKDLVPKNWELICQRTDGSTQTVSGNVMAFCAGHDGTIHYSNGRGVFSITSADAKPVKISSRALVTSIAEIG